MKLVRIRYNTALPLRQDLQRVFPRWNGSIEDWGNAEKKRHVYIKVYFNPVTKLRTHAIVHLLVRDSFTVPLWVQGIVLLDSDVTNPIDHRFLGHEVPIIDPANEVPEEAII